MDQLTTVGIDLAKDLFAICVLDATGAVLQRRVLRREAFIRWAEQLSPCRVAMEACGSSHHWGRWFAARGHTALLIPAEFVKPFRPGGKIDAADAEAIAVAARQPTMRLWQSNLSSSRRSWPGIACAMAGRRNGQHC